MIDEAELEAITHAVYAGSRTRNPELDVRKLLNEVNRLRDANTTYRRALESIFVRCHEGDKRVNWLPAIGNIAREALRSIK